MFFLLVLQQSDTASCSCLCAALKPKAIIKSSASSSSSSSSMAFSGIVSTFPLLNLIFLYFEEINWSHFVCFLYCLVWLANHLEFSVFLCHVVDLNKAAAPEYDGVSKNPVFLIPRSLGRRWPAMFHQDFSLQVLLF